MTGCLVNYDLGNFNTIYVLKLVNLQQIIIMGNGGFVDFVLVNHRQF